MGSDNPVTFRSGDDLVKASRRCVITERLIPRRIIGLSLDLLQDAYPICEKKGFIIGSFFLWSATCRPISLWAGRSEVGISDNDL